MVTSGPPLNFLFAEDRPGDALLIREAFRTAGSPVNLYVASDGAGAMDFLGRQGGHTEAPRPDLIVIDLNFAATESREVLIYAKEAVHLRAIPTIIVNASEAEVELMRSYERQCDCRSGKSSRLEAFENLRGSINDFWLAKSRLLSRSSELLRDFHAKLGDLVRHLDVLRQSVEADRLGREKIDSVLLIQAAADSLPLLGDILGQRNIKLVYAKTVKEAETQLAAQAVDVVLLDLNLPHGSGLAAVRSVRSAAPAVPLVVLTESDDDAIISGVMREGAIDCLVKGELATSTLSRSLRYALARRSVEDELRWERERAQLARAQARAKSSFLAAVSHELRTPLNGILGYAQLLHLEGGLNPVQAARVDAMLGAGAHLLQMISGVLDLSEIEAGQMEVQQAEFDLRDIAAACLDFVRPAAEGKKLALNLVMEPDLPQRLTTDATRLRQVLLNLLANAVKFTVKGSVALRVGLGADRMSLRFEVADTGPGISIEHRESMFQEFKRLDAHLGGLLEGAGLGLAIAGRLTALLGGHLRHVDNPVGGSIFCLELPLSAGTVSTSAEPTTPDAIAASDSQLSPVRGLRVLVVDDIAMNLDIAGSFLRAAGHTVTCAEGGADAVAVAAAGDFDVVLMDVRMPGVDGLEATRRIRALRERGGVPIVAMTAHAFTEQVEECRKAGMDGHVTKPFTPETLLDAVLRAAETRPSSAQAKAAGLGASASDQDRPSDAAGSVPCTARAVPDPDAGLPVLDQAAFQRTAGYLAPEVVARHLSTIADRGEALLRQLKAPNGGIAPEVAEAAHALAGSAGMFGFQRLASLARRFQHAVQADSEDALALGRYLIAAVEEALRAISSRVSVAGAA